MNILLLVLFVLCGGRGVDQTLISYPYFIRFAIIYLIVKHLLFM